MDDVMKKRIIGVIVLVLLGISIPMLLSHWMSSGDGGRNSRGSMRVYEITPSGNAEPASDTSGHPNQGEPHVAGASAGPQASNTQRSASSASPSTSAQTTGSGSTSATDGDGFSVPPVHGGSAAAPTTAGSAQSAPAVNGGSHDAGDTDHSAVQPPATASPSTGAGQAPSGSPPHQGKPQSGWVVQVASFTDADRAKRLADQLQGQFKAYYRAGDVNGTTYYRVFIGPFAGENAARSTADRLRKRGRKPLVRHLP